MTDSRNLLYYGDNLDALRGHVADESVDLVYLDPPFNSQATHNVPFAQEDAWPAPASSGCTGRDRAVAVGRPRLLRGIV